MNITISYSPESDVLIACDDNGEVIGYADGEPITAGTDSWAVVDRFAFPGEVQSVDHDGEYIHVFVAASEAPHA